MRRNARNTRVGAHRRREPVAQHVAQEVARVGLVRLTARRGSSRSAIDGRVVPRLDLARPTRPRTSRRGARHRPGCAATASASSVACTIASEQPRPYSGFVHVWASPTAWKPSTAVAAVDERRGCGSAACAITCTGVIGSARPGRPTARGRRASRPARSNVVGVEQRARSSSSSTGDRERDRERAVVAEERRVLQVAEVAADRPDLLGDVGAVAQPVEAREVDDARCPPRPPGRRRRRRRATPARRRAGRWRRPRGRRRRRRRRRPSRARRSTTPSPPSEAVDHDAVEQLHVRRGEHDRAQHPLERRAPAGEHHEVLVAGLRARVVDRRRQVDRQRPVGGAGGVERLRARRGSGRAGGCAAGRAGRGSGGPAGRPGGPTRRPRRGRGAAACGPARAR